MTTYIALLRAVNVGGTGKIAMVELRAALEELGFAGVRTYIQSGNALFHAVDTRPQVRRKIEQALATLMGAAPGVEVRNHVMVRTPAELRRVMERNPFAAEAAADGARVHVGFLAGPAGPGAQAALEEIVRRYPERRDRFHLDGDTLYLHLPDGAGETKLTGKAVDRALGVPGTVRNWNTVRKLYDMSAEG